MLCVEDTCRLKSKPWMIGVVDRTHNDVDSHEPNPQEEYGLPIEKHPIISQSNFSKFLRDGIPPQGTALISWQTDFVSELLPVSELEIVDRSLFVGDIVKRSAKDPMSGSVIGTSMKCVLAPIRMWPEVEEIRTSRGYETLIGDATNAPVRDVPASEVTPVRQWPEGGLIVYENWVGRIDDAVDEVTVRLGNGTIVVVENPDELTPIDPRLERHEIGDFVRTKKGNLRRGRWVFGAFNPNVDPSGVVIDVRTVTVSAAWLSLRLGAEMPGSFTHEPPVDLNLDELESGRVHLYDATKSPASPPEGSVSFQSQDLTAGQRVRFKDMSGACVKYNMQRTPRADTSGYDTNIFTVQTTETKVVVQWQDLSVTEETSASLLPDPNVDDEDEVWPGEIVCSSEYKAPDSTSTWYKEPKKVGVVQTVDGVERMATVRWFNQEDTVVRFVGNDLLPGAKTGPVTGPAEKNSLYDIKRPPPALMRRRGDYVIIYANSYGAATGASMSSDDIDWFGEVVDLGLDGLMTVRLGAMDPVRDVKVRPECAVLAYSADFDDHAADPAYEEMSDEEEDWDDDMDEDMDPDAYADMWYEYQGQNGEQVRVEAVSEDEEWSTEDEAEGSSAEDGDVEMADAAAKEVDTSKTTPELQPTNAVEAASTEPKANGEGASSKESSGTGEPLSFSTYPDAPPAFAVLDSDPPSDHHYINTTVEHSPQRMRRIAKEHKILNSSLPPGILVRTWESRLDLLRVLIIGPIDTPYEYAPFLIDFHLGSNYPMSAPEAFFHSWTNGLGPVNPNLYEDGKICLSLLGTWHADERNENWSPGKSTLLQVLVSLLGLVLVKEPYYNEAGYEVRAGTEESALPSALYSEKTYFRARNFIFHALSHLPAPFADDIKWVYRDERGPRLLEKAIEAAEGIIERSEGEEQNGGARDGLKRVSRGAVTMLKRQVEGLQGLR